jgi:hypothetical protein
MDRICPTRQFSPQNFVTRVTTEPFFRESNTR